MNRIDGLYNPEGAQLFSSQPLVPDKTHNLRKSGCKLMTKCRMIYKLKNRQVAQIKVLITKELQILCSQFNIYSYFMLLFII